MPRIWPFLIALSALGCGGAQFDGHTYRGEGLAFRVGPVPDGWRELQASHALLAFRDDADGATIGVNGRCGQDGDDVPLEALTHHLFIHFTDRELKSQQTLALDGRDALRTEIVAELDGVPKAFTIYVLKKDGCVYDFLYIADVGRGAPEQFDRFVTGFRTLQ